jgi:hypothetical protein
METTRLGATGWPSRFEQHHDGLTTVAYQLLGSRTEVDDAVQQAWPRLSHPQPRRNRDARRVANHSRLAHRAQHTAARSRHDEPLRSSNHCSNRARSAFRLARCGAAALRSCASDPARCRHLARAQGVGLRRVGSCSPCALRSRLPCRNGLSESRSDERRASARRRRARGRDAVSAPLVVGKPFHPAPADRRDVGHDAQTGLLNNAPSLLDHRAAVAIHRIGGHPSSDPRREVPRVVHVPVSTSNSARPRGRRSAAFLHQGVVAGEPDGRTSHGRV